jgi:Holliday junction resolvase-like predicted endonuclease
MPSERLKPREQGDLGELSAMQWFVSQGARIYTPVFHSPDVDLIAELGGQVFRVQVKTSTFRNKRGRWDVLISTRGGNQSWNRVAKYFDWSRCDLLFVHVGDGRRWLIPSPALECKSGLTLGGPKYSEFEVESGEPIVRDAGSRIVESTSGERRSGRAGPGCKPGATALRGFESLLPHQPEIPTGPSARTRVSSNHQITIPLGPFRSAGLEVGQAIRVTASGDGHLVLERIEVQSA